MNTRRYPRTLSEAFPHTADYASAVERSHKNKIANYAIGFVIGFGLTLCLISWFVQQ